MLQRNEVQQAVIEIVAAKANLPVERIHPETHFINDLSFDSLELVELTMQIEDRFDITMPDDEAQMLLTVQLLVYGICDYCRRANSA